MSSSRHPASGPSNLRTAFDSFVADAFHRKALFDLNGLSAPCSGNSVTEAPLNHFERHLYFVTFHVRPNAYSARDGFSSYNAQPTFAAFRSWYISVCKKLLGPRFNKKPNLQPFTMAFLDVEGSRHGKAAKAFEIPHIHALMLVHPRVDREFATLSESGVLGRTHDPRVGKIDIEPFRDDGRGAGPVMTYAAKYPRQTINESRHEATWHLYPDLRAERYSFLKAGTTGSQTFARLEFQ